MILSAHSPGQLFDCSGEGHYLHLHVSVLLILHLIDDLLLSTLKHINLFLIVSHHLLLLMLHPLDLLLEVVDLALELLFEWFHAKDFIGIWGSIATAKR